MAKDLIDYNICNFMQKCTHNKAPSSFQNLFIKNRNFYSCLIYNLKLGRKTSLRSFPKLVFPRVWNALTLESKRSESLSFFKKKVIIWKNTMFLAVFKTANHEIVSIQYTTCSILTSFIKNYNFILFVFLFRILYHICSVLLSILCTRVG